MLTLLQAQARPSTVESDPLEGVPTITESNVDSLSEQVTNILCIPLCVSS